MRQCEGSWIVSCEGVHTESFVCQWEHPKVSEREPDSASRAHVWKNHVPRALPKRSDLIDIKDALLKCLKSLKAWDHEDMSDSGVRHATMNSSDMRSRQLSELAKSKCTSMGGPLTLEGEISDVGRFGDHSGSSITPDGETRRRARCIEWSTRISDSVRHEIDVLRSALVGFRGRIIGLAPKPGCKFSLIVAN